MKRILSLILAIIMLASTIFISTISIYAGTNGKTASDALTWASQQIGQRVGGGQCVDFIAHYYSYLGATTPGGNGADYTWNALPSGWQRIQGAQPQPGDILVYTGGYENLGHVAIYESDYLTYHQNFNGYYVERITYKYNELLTPYWGVIRPDFSQTSHNPQGVIDSITSSNGVITVVGWAFDYDAPSASIGIHAYVGENNSSNGEGHNLGYTNVNRNDVNKIYGLTGVHGFRYSFPTNKSGKQDVYVFAINNFGGGSNVCLGTWNIDVEPHTTHEYSFDKTLTEASCDKEGVDQYKCWICGATEQRNTKSLEHTIVTSQSVEPTCEESGKTEGSYCSVCGLVMKEQEIIKPLGHTLIFDKIVEPSCSEQGYTLFNCSLCNKQIKSDFQPRLEHTLSETVTENFVDYTCDTDGSYDEVVYCTVCKAEVSRETKYIKSAHRYELTKYIEPNCVNEGLTILECTECSDVIKEAIEKTDVHTAGFTEIANIVPNSCTADGSYEKRTICAYCYELYDTVTVVVPKTNHIIMNRTEFSAVVGCENDGQYDTVTYCHECGTELERVPHIVPATGHYYVYSDCNDGVMSYSCSYCDDVYQKAKDEVVDIWSIDFVNASVCDNADLQYLDVVQDGTINAKDYARIMHIAKYGY